MESEVGVKDQIQIMEVEKEIGRESVEAATRRMEIEPRKKRRRRRKEKRRKKRIQYTWVEVKPPQTPSRTFQNNP
jgi:hypothetical protein